MAQDTKEEPEDRGPPPKFMRVVTGALIFANWIHQNDTPGVVQQKAKQALARADDFLDEVRSQHPDLAELFPS